MSDTNILSRAKSGKFRKSRSHARYDKIRQIKIEHMIAAVIIDELIGEICAEAVRENIENRTIIL